MIVSAAKAREAADVLEVELNSLTSSALSKAYKKKAKECHPDHHKSERLSMWARVSWAKDCLTMWLERNPMPVAEPEVKQGDCRACGGTGRVNARRAGFGTPLTMSCVVCKGLGTVIPEENDGD